MIAPEVCHFPSPPCSFQFEEGSSKESETSIVSTIHEHHFNHSVSVVIPDTVMISPDIFNSLSQDGCYYKVLQVPVSEFTKKPFIDAFIKKGQLTAMSVDTQLDSDNCFCLTPSGNLVLSLNKTDYEELGLEGRPSFFSRTTPANRYYVVINLKADHFKPGKKNYSRVQWCLSHSTSLKFNVILSWEPPDDTTCPSSVAAYFDKLQYQVEVCEPEFAQRRDAKVEIPDITNCSPEELLEWLGAYSLEADISDTVDNFVSTYQPPVKCDTPVEVAYLQWTGLFTTQKIQKLYQLLRQFIESRSSLPFVALHVQGFDDTPVSWDLQEHYYHQSGDNAYTIFLQPQKFLTCRTLGARRKPFTGRRTDTF